MARDSRREHHCGTIPTAMEESRVSLQISLPVSMDQKLTVIQQQLGLRSKSSLIERLLQEIFDADDGTTE